MQPQPSADSTLATPALVAADPLVFVAPTVASGAGKGCKMKASTTPAKAASACRRAAALQTANILSRLGDERLVASQIEEVEMMKAARYRRDHPREQSCRPGEGSDSSSCAWPDDELDRIWRLYGAP